MSITILTGSAGNDTLNASTDFGDKLIGLTGADTMVGGKGDDDYYVDSTGDVTTELAGQGTDRVLASATVILGTNVENLTLLGGADLGGTGNGADNILIGNIG